MNGVPTRLPIFQNLETSTFPNFSIQSAPMLPTVLFRLQITILYIYSSVFVYLQIVILYSLVSYNFCKLCMYRICRKLKNLNMFDSNPLFYILLFDMTRNDGLILCGRGGMYHLPWKAYLFPVSIVCTRICILGVGIFAVCGKELKFSTYNIYWPDHMIQ